MRQTLNFRDEKAAIRALRADTMYYVIWEYLMELRNVYKYSEVEGEIREAERWRDRMLNLLAEHGINLDEEWE